MAELEVKPPQRKVIKYKTPTVIQALALPFFPPPREKGMEEVSYLADPKVQQLKKEVLICTVFMVLVPILTFL